MSQRPPRRQSRLAGEHPAYPHAAPTDVEPASAQPPPVSPAAVATAPPPAPAAPPARMPAAAPAPRSKKFTSAIDEQVYERMKNAAAVAMARGDHVTLNEFVEAALLDYTKKLERSWNEGEPFRTRPRRDFPRGRKMS